MALQLLQVLGEGLSMSHGRATFHYGHYISVTYFSRIIAFSLQCRHLDDGTVMFN